MNYIKRILTHVEINEDFIPNSNLEYSVYYDGSKQFQAILENTPRNKTTVGYKDAPKSINYTLDKPLNMFTEEEKRDILHYRGLSLKDGFEIGDVFMEKSFITLKKYK